MTKLFNYWITKEGKLYEVDWMGHSEFAYEYLIKEMGYDEVHELDIPVVEYLHETLGWIRLLQWNHEKHPTLLGNCSSNEILYDTMKPRMSFEQKRVMKRFCFDNGLNYDKLFEGG